MKKPQKSLLKLKKSKLKNNDPAYVHSDSFTSSKISV